MRITMSLLCALAGCGADPATDTTGSDALTSEATSAADGASSSAAEADDGVGDDGPIESGPPSGTAGSEDTASPTTTGGDGEPSDDGGPLPAGCYDYDAFEPTAVGFRADVMPILAAACSGCHADPSKSIYFGTGGTTEPEAAAVYAKLLEGVSIQAPHLAFVAPGDPLHSYMMAKVEYPIPGATCPEVECAEPGCELPAPPAGPIAESDKAILRSWILGGAQDD